MGRGYVIEHCMSALRLQAQERLYKTYVTDALKLIAENASKAAVPGVGVIDVGAVFTKRWIEIAEPQEKKNVDPPKTGDEIAADIMRRAGLHQKGGE